jgi:hypothetical protein
MSVRVLIASLQGLPGEASGALAGVCGGFAICQATIVANTNALTVSHLDSFMVIPWV